MNDRRRAALAAIVAITLVELIRTAWISDDAAITLRTVLNLVNGFGARFNIDERVQAYTHPLWFLLITAVTFVTRNVFVANFALSIVLSLAVVWLLMTRVACTFWTGLLGVSVLVLARSYVDFSTSGLENPLAHLLIVVAVLTGAGAAGDAAVTRYPAAFLVTCSLLYLCRPDLPLVMLPLAGLVAARHWQAPAPLLKSAALAVLPVAAWTLFSLFYYGFPVPNTAYAKLGAGIARRELVEQGVLYLLDSLRHDPLTLTIIVLGAAAGLRRAGVDAALALGSLLYLAYVVSVGGDFMSGRFLTVPLLLSTIVIARTDLSQRLLVAAAAVVGLLGAVALRSTLLSGASYAFDDEKIPESGIVNERGYYFQRYGLIAAPEGRFAQPRWDLGPRSVQVLCGSLGFTGIDGGPGLHLIDTCGLSDPLLARLPAERTRRWRIGHFYRQLPTDYQESVAGNGNVLADPKTREFYRSIRLITRGRLLNSTRLREVVLMNLGFVPRPDWDMYYKTKVPESSRSDASAGSRQQAVGSRQ